MTSHQDIAARLRDPDFFARTGTREELKAAADLLEAQIKALGEAESARERMWCTACGTVTRDGVCDCNRYGQDREPHFVNYADQNHKDLLEECKRAEALEARALAAEALLAEARKVIEPFAAQADTHGEQIPDSLLIDDYTRDQSKPWKSLARITVGQLRAARSFLNAAKEKT